MGILWFMLVKLFFWKTNYFMTKYQIWLSICMWYLSDEKIIIAIFLLSLISMEPRRSSNPDIYSRNGSLKMKKMENKNAG